MWFACKCKDGDQPKHTRISMRRGMRIAGMKCSVCGEQFKRISKYQWNLDADKKAAAEQLMADARGEIQG